jgi:hypothetical protein
MCYHRCGAGSSCWVTLGGRCCGQYADEFDDDRLGQFLPPCFALGLRAGALVAGVGCGHELLPESDLPPCFWTAAGCDPPKALKPVRKRQLVDHACATWQVSIRRASRALPVVRSTYHYRSRRAGQAHLTGRIREIAATRLRYGYRRIHVLLRREGWRINPKRVPRMGSSSAWHSRPAQIGMKSGSSRLTVSQIGQKS